MLQNLIESLFIGLLLWPVIIIPVILIIHQERTRLTVPFFRTVPQDGNFPSIKIKREIDTLGLRHISNAFVQVHFREEDVAFYSTPDQMIRLTIVRIKTNTTRWTIFEFSSRLEPFGLLDTNNIPMKHGLAERPGHFLIRAPNVNKIKKLYQLHRSLLKEAAGHGFTVRPENYETAEELYRQLREDERSRQEWQVRCGDLITIDDGLRALSWRGAARITIATWIWLMSRPTAWLYRPSFKTYRRRFAKELQKAKVRNEVEKPGVGS